MLPGGASLLPAPLLGTAVLALDVGQPRAGDWEGAVDPGAALQAPSF